MHRNKETAPACRDGLFIFRAGIRDAMSASRVPTLGIGQALLELGSKISGKRSRQLMQPGFYITPCVGTEKACVHVLHHGEKGGPGYGEGEKVRPYAVAHGGIQASQHATGLISFQFIQRVADEGIAARAKGGDDVFW